MSHTTISQRTAKSRKLRIEQEIEDKRSEPAYKAQVDAVVVELTNFLTMIRNSVEFNLGCVDQPRYVYQLRLLNKFVPVGSTRYSTPDDIEADAEYLTDLIATVPEIQNAFLEFGNFCTREGLRFDIEDNNHGSWCPDDVFKHIEFIISERDLECEMEPEHITSHSINKTASFWDRLYYLIFGTFK